MFTHFSRKYATGCHGRDCMIVGFTTTYAFSAYRLCDKDCQ